MVDIPGSAIDTLGQGTAAETASQALAFAGNPGILVGAIVLIVIAVVLVLLFKRIFINSILGLVAWVILTYNPFIQAKLPFWASLIVSAIFGLAGIGVMLVLRFLGMR